MIDSPPVADPVPVRRQGRPTKEEEWTRQIADLNGRLADNTAAGEKFAFEELNDGHPLVVERARLLMEEGDLTASIVRRLLLGQRDDVSALVKRFFKTSTGWDI